VSAGNSRTDSVQPDRRRKQRRTPTTAVLYSTAPRSAVFPADINHEGGHLAPEMELLLSRRLVQSVESDLARASLNIHDGVAQSMSNAAQILKVVQSSSTLDAEDRERINRVIVLLREGVADARLISRELQPASLERVGLEKTLKYELETLAMVGVVSTFAFHLNRPMSKQLETTFYRIASEALLNVKKHSRATFVTLSIAGRKDSITMTISDDGDGFVSDTRRCSDQTSLGLMSMQARAMLQGGSFTINSAKGAGTLITVVLPNPEARVEESLKKAAHAKKARPGRRSGESQAS